MKRKLNIVIEKIFLLVFINYLNLFKIKIDV